MTHPLHRISLVLAALIACAAGNTDTPENREAELRVALFPWIPDAADDSFASLRRSIVERFEAAHPDVKLTLRLSKGDDKYYDPVTLAGWLASGMYDVVEIDAVLLGDLLEADVIAPWPTQDERMYFPSAVEAARLTEANSHTWWGIPHLLCGFFLITDDARVDSAASLRELANAVRANTKPVLGNFDSSWDLPSLYLDGRVDNGLEVNSIALAVRPPVDTITLSAVRTLANLCQDDDGNICITGFEDFDDPVLRFVAGEAAGFWGYSERLHLTVRELRKAGQGSNALRVNTIPLGDDAIPLLFVDLLVRSQSCVRRASCTRHSEAFADFLTSDAQVGDLLLSRDAGTGAVPRYLLPATRSAFEIDGVKSDRLFGELFAFAASGHAFPNRGELYERRRALAWLLQEGIQR